MSNIKITKQEAEEMEYHSLAAMSPAYSFMTLNENPQEKYKACWDKLAKKYNFDPHFYTYDKQQKEFKKK